MENTDVFAGFDLTPGAGQGTWFGVSTHGKVGTLLNILRGNPIPNGKRSRGKLRGMTLLFLMDACN